MNKELLLLITGVFALLLIAGVGPRIVEARVRTMCPADCSVYVDTTSGQVALVSIAHNLELDSKIFTHIAMKQTDLEKVMIELCTQACVVYKNESGFTIPEYSSDMHSASNDLHYSMCPKDCSVYVAADGSILLTSIESEIDINGTVFAHINVDGRTLNRTMKQECKSGCQIYSVSDGVVEAIHTATF
jgi:hypothetical protein